MKLTHLVLFAALTSAAAAQTPEGTRLPVRGRTLSVDVLVESPSSAPGDLQIICLFESTPDNKLMASLETLDSKLDRALTKIRSPHYFRGSLGETLLLTPKPGAIGAKRLLIIGLGNRDAFTPDLEEFVGEIAYAESERLGVAKPTFAPTLIDGGKAGVDTGATAEAFLHGFLRARNISLTAGKTQVVEALTYLAGPTHAHDTQHGLEAGPMQF